MRDPLAWIPVRYKLPLTFVFFCLVALGLGGYAVATMARESLSQQIQLRLNERAAFLNEIVDQSLDLLGRRVEDFASDGHIRLQMERLVEGGSAGDRAELIRHLNVNKLPLVAEFEEAVLLDAAGRVVVATHARARSAPAGFDRDASWVGPLTGENDRYPFPTFVLSTPVSGIHDGRRLGYLQIIVRADTWAGSLGDALGFPGATGFSARLGRPGGYTLTLASAAEERADRIRFTSTVARSGWQLDLGVDEGVLAIPIETMLRNFAYVGFVLIALTLGMLLFPQVFLLKPLSALQDAARRIAEGDFSARVDYRSRDEVGDLAGAFNFMAGAVEERTRKLEQTAEVLERREADIRFERDRLNAVIRSMEDGLFILGPDGRITLSNVAARPVIEAMAKAGAGCRKHDGAVSNCLHCIADFGRDVQGCVVNVGARIYEINGAVLSGPGQAIAGKVFVSRDVTVRVRQSEQHAHQERLAVLGEIAAVMAHELNSPLAAISMFSQMLLKGLDRGSGNHAHAEVIYRNTESCKATIRALLDMATTSTAEFDTFDVRQLVADVVQLLEPVAHREEIAVRLGTQAADPRAFGDELQLRQAVVNLVMNSIQALDGGPAAEVVVETDDRGHEVAIVVRDNGPGIPEELRGRIFEPFYTTKPPGDGTGLGLPTSRRIVDVQGGRLTLIEAEPGSTIFEIVVPRQAVAQRPPALQVGVLDATREPR